AGRHHLASMTRRGSGKRAVQPPPERRALGQQVEGRQAVRELLRAGTRRVHDVWLASDTPPSPLLDEIAELAQRCDARRRRVPGEQVERRARTDAPQGVVAFAAPLPIAEPDELFAPPDAFVVALDGVTDPQNLGAIMRSAETAGVGGIVLPTHRAVGLTPA